MIAKSMAERPKKALGGCYFASGIIRFEARRNTGINTKTHSIVPFCIDGVN